MKKLYCLLFLVFPIAVNAQTITLIAGHTSGVITGGYSGDGGPATAAQLNGASWLACDASGNILIAESTNRDVRKIDPSGIITTIAGRGSVADSFSDGGPATDAMFCQPHGITLDNSGNYYVLDYGSDRARKINASDIITTFAGNEYGQCNVGDGGYSGDGGPATDAALRRPLGIAIDPLGNIFIADAQNLRVRKINTSGIITTFAGGNSVSGPIGDGGPATDAVVVPGDVAADGAGNIFIIDGSNSSSFRIRKVDATGIITTVAGGGAASITNGVQATSVLLYNPVSIAVDNVGNIYIADRLKFYIYKVDAAATISIFAGNGLNGYGYEGVATATAITPTSVTVDSSGNILFTDGIYIYKISNSLEVKNVVSSNNTIQLLPNPVTTFLAITSTDRITNLTITNLIGQVVYNHTYSSERIELDVADLPQGVYIAKINGFEVKKFVKQ